MAKITRKKIERELRERFENEIADSVTAYLDETRDRREQELYGQIEERRREQFEEAMPETTMNKRAAIEGELEDSRDEREEALAEQIEERLRDEFEEGLEDAIQAEMECV